MYAEQARKKVHWTTGGNWIIYDVNDQQVIYFLEKKQLPRTRRKNKSSLQKGLLQLSLLNTFHVDTYAHTQVLSE